MGIQGLSKLIADYAPSAIKQGEIKNYFGRKVAIDASMSIYQFLIAVRQEGNMLTNADGETTSHLMGIFYRTIRMIENGIKPVYVFDGKPPDMKSHELVKRTEKREIAEIALKKAEEEGEQQNIEKFSKRLVKVTKEHNDDCKKLLKLMGIPYIEVIGFKDSGHAPCEAEAQCADLVKNDVVYAVGTEDMDALTFGSNVLLRHLTFSEARKMPIKEFNHQKILNELELSSDEFIDLCILLGCDYCESIRGIGPKRAIDLIRQYRTIENIIDNIDTKKYTIPDPWPFARARELFKEPDVIKDIKVKWEDPDIEELVKYMCERNGFSEDRIRNGAKKLIKGKQSATQVRLDSFFKVTPGAVKRKSEDNKSNIKKKGKMSSGKAGKTGKYKR